MKVKGLLWILMLLVLCLGISHTAFSAVDNEELLKKLNDLTSTLQKQ